jgi:phenylpyruvate tautomerase PptA (4-oxalocrotonate tautomerase family)
MPNVVIELRQPYSPEQELAIIDAVHSALVAHFHIPERDKNIRLLNHLAHRFAAPSHLAQPEFYTQISIDAFSGRSLDAKRQLYRGIVDNLQLLGIPAPCVMITLGEIAPENWGIRGGQAACDVAQGFTVDV